MGAGCIDRQIDTSRRLLVAIPSSSFLSQERTPDFSDLRNKIAEVEGEKKKLRERKNRFAAKLDDQ